MSSFLKLNNYILNARYINNIKFDSNIYTISMISNNHSGGFIYGSGYFSTNPCILHISKKQDEEDYNKITKWIENDFKTDT